MILIVQQNYFQICIQQILDHSTKSFFLRGIGLVNKLLLCSHLHGPWETQWRASSIVKAWWGIMNESRSRRVVNAPRRFARQLRHAHLLREKTAICARQTFIINIGWYHGISASSPSD